MDLLVARSRCIFCFVLTNPNQVFQYNGGPITFQKENSVMINATEMAGAWAHPQMALSTFNFFVRGNYMQA